jgi:DNA adenine methylase
VIVPQPFQYQGSKRSLAPAILRYLPVKMRRLVEPFAGSAALSLASAASRRAKAYWLNDYNQPLAELLNLIINQPEELADAYKKIWRAQEPETLEHYYRAREDFNRTNDPRLFLYLLARCVKGSVRYNADGLFNQSPDKRRRGTHPATMRENILGVSSLFHGKTIVTAHGYQDVLANVTKDDVVYMDPPYQGVCGERDGRYFSGIKFDEFVVALDLLNRRGVRFLVSYDGRTGGRVHGQPLPDYLDLILVELEAGRSSQATLLGRDEMTVESLYLSANLAAEIGVVPHLYKRKRVEQMALLESAATYGKVSKKVS